MHIRRGDTRCKCVVFVRSVAQCALFIFLPAQHCAQFGRMRAQWCAVERRDVRSGAQCVRSVCSFPQCVCSVSAVCPQCVRSVSAVCAVSFTLLISVSAVCPLCPECVRSVCAVCAQYVRSVCAGYAVCAQGTQCVRSESNPNIGRNI